MKTRNTIALLLSLALLYLSKPLAAQTDDNTSKRWSMVKTDTRAMVNSVLHVYSRPAHWRQKDWLTFGGIMLGTGLLNLIDEPANDWLIRFDDDIPKGIEDAAFYFGKPQYNYGLTATVFAIGILSKNPKIRRSSTLLISSATAAGLIQSVSKTVVGRARPSAFEGSRSFKLFSPEPNFHSFPSGHTILAFTTAYAIGKQFKNPWVKAGIYTVGMLTPSSRLWRNAHWPTDVALSVAISIVVVDSIDKFLGRTYDKGRPHAISWKVAPRTNGIGLTGIF